jgi:hydrogenase maturation protein HypF
MIMRQMLEREINAPRTSSVGRLFDAVSALCGVRSEVNYEAQAAIELEALADRAERGAYVFEVNGGNIQTAALIRAIVSDLRSGVAVPVISARFHNGLAEVILRVCARIRAEQGLGSVALSGGVWQNMLLLERTVGGLREAGFRVHQHHKIPANDGGVSLGQAMIAGMRLLANKAGPMAAMSLERGEE